MEVAYTDGDPQAGSVGSSSAGPRISRGAQRIVVVTVLAVVALCFMAVWVLWVPVTVDHPGWRNGGRAFDCDQLTTAEISAIRAEVEERCDDAESTRRTTGLVTGAVVVTVAFAVSTWPSRRLTGEALGPVPPSGDDP